MNSLYELADVVRSKNAGPLLITIDLLFDKPEIFDRVMASEVITPDLIEEIYGIPQNEVRVVPFAAALAIKITFPRVGPLSGSPGDRDVYGAQQHTPIAEVKIP